MPRFSVALLAPTVGNANMNSASRRGVQIAGFPGATYSETSFPMTKAEEDAIRRSFRNLPGMDPVTAETLAEEAMAIDPHYRASDAAPKYNGSTPSSSFIQGVDVSPGLGLATITMKNGRSYSYPISPDKAAMLINSGSLGKFYNANIKLKRAGSGAASMPKKLMEPEAVGTSVGMAMENMPPSAITRAGKNLAKSGTSPSTAINAYRASLGGAALGGAGLMILAQIMKAAEEEEAKQD